MVPYSRRSFVSVITATVIPVLSGCASVTETTSTPEQTQKSIPQKSTTKSTQSQATEKTTIQFPSKKDYSFGEWYDDGLLQYTVEDIELLSSFTTDDGDQRSIPADEQLLLATTRVKNVDTEPFAQLGGGRLIALVTGEPQHDTYRIRLSTGEKLDIDELAEVEHVRRWGPEGYSIYPGETVTSWFTFVVPANAARKDVEIAFNWETDEDRSFPIRWRPSQS